MSFGALSSAAARIAFGDNDPRREEDYKVLNATAGAYDDWHEGKDPAGNTTRNPELAARLDPVAAGRRLSNYLKVITLEAHTIARACGKNNLHNLARSFGDGTGAAGGYVLDTGAKRFLEYFSYELRSDRETGHRTIAGRCWKGNARKEREATLDI